MADDGERERDGPYNNGPPSWKPRKTRRDGSWIDNPGAALIEGNRCSSHPRFCILRFVLCRQCEVGSPWAACQPSIGTPRGSDGPNGCTKRSHGVSRRLAGPVSPLKSLGP